MEEKSEKVEEITCHMCDEIIAEGEIKYVTSLLGHDIEVTEPYCLECAEMVEMGDDRDDEDMVIANAYAEEIMAALKQEDRIDEEKDSD